MKNFTLKTLFMSALLCVGLSTRGAEKTITLDYSSFGLTTSYSTKTATVGGFGFTVDQGYKGTGNSIQMNSTKGSGILYNTTAITGLKSITINVYSGNKTYYITTGTSEKPTANSQTGTTGGTYNAASGDTYFQLKVSGASYFSSIVITYEDTPEGSVAAPMFNPGAGTYTESQSVTLTSSTTNATIYYTTDGSNPTTTNGTQYSSAITVSEPTTIKAIAVKEGLDNSSVSTAQYSFKVATPTFSIDGDTYQTAQSVEINSTTTGATIYYTLDGTEPTTSSTEYTGAVLVSTSGTQLKAIAVKEGWINSNVTAAATYTIRPAKPTITANEATITLECETPGVTIYYTLDKTTPTAKGLVYSAPFEIDNSCTVKAIAIDAYGNESYSETKDVTIVVNHSPNTNYFVKVANVSELAAGDNIILVNEDANVAMGEQNTNNRKVASVVIENNVIANISDKVQKLILQGGSGAWYFYTGEGFLHAASSSNNYLKTEVKPDDNAIASISMTANGDATITFQGSNTRNVLRYNESSSLFSCYAENSTVNGAVQIYKEVPVTVTIGSTGYATYCTPKAVSFGNDVTAYVVSAVGTDNVTLTEVESVPANTPVVVKADAADTYTLTVEASAEAVGDNYLKVSNGSITSSDGSTVFALANMDGVVGFYAVANGTTIPAGKCYIDGTTETKSRLTFNFESEDATAITAIEAADAIQNGVIYNLSGQRVVKPLKGIYIQNGKKILVK